MENYTMKEQNRIFEGQQEYINNTYAYNVYIHIQT